MRVSTVVALIAIAAVMGLGYRLFLSSPPDWSTSTGVDEDAVVRPYRGTKPPQVESGQGTSRATGLPPDTAIKAPPASQPIDPPPVFAIVPTREPLAAVDPLPATQSPPATAASPRPAVASSSDSTRPAAGPSARPVAAPVAAAPKVPPAIALVPGRIAHASSGPTVPVLGSASGSPGTAPHAGLDPNATLRIKLPFGAVLTQANVDLPARWREEFFPKGTPVYVALYPNEAVKGVFTVRQRKLDGPSAMLYDNGLLSALAQYSNGQVHGPLRLWEENKQRLLYAEYSSGERHGLVCLFNNGRPWLVQQWTKGELRQQHLIKFLDRTPLVIPQMQLAGQQTKEFSEAVHRLDELNTAIAKGQEELLAWLKTEDDHPRKDGVAASVPRRSTAKRQLDTAATLESSWRKALEHSGF